MSAIASIADFGAVTAGKIDDRVAAIAGRVELAARAAGHPVTHAAIVEAVRQHAGQDDVWIVATDTGLLVAPYELVLSDVKVPGNVRDYNGAALKLHAAGDTRARLIDWRMMSESPRPEPTGPSVRSPLPADSSSMTASPVRRAEPAPPPPSPTFEMLVRQLAKAENISVTRAAAIAVREHPEEHDAWRARGCPPIEGGEPGTADGRDFSAFAAAALQMMNTEKCSYNVALAKAAKAQPESHRAWVNAGCPKIGK